MIARSNPVGIGPKPKPEPPDNDQKVIWLAVRRGLLVIVRAIEVRYGVGDKEKAA